MQPSQDNTPSEPSALRRFGPIVAIIAVIAVIIGLVVSSGDDDDVASDDPTSSSTGVDDSDEDGVDDDDEEEEDEAPQLGISFQQAEDDGLDVTFPDTCDIDRGRVAIPYFFAAPCFANVDDNGGATHTGVTEDSISVVYYSAPENDPILAFITGPIQNDDTQAEIEQTVETFVEFFNTYYQTYGRTVDLHVVRGSGIASDEVAARADAQRAIEEHKPFAAFGGPALTNAWADEMAAAGIVCVACGATGSEEFREERAPFLIGIGMAANQTNIHVAEFVASTLAGKNAEYGGPDVVDTERVFAHVYIRASAESDLTAGQLADQLEERDVTLVEQLSYELDPGRLPEQATSVISKLKDAGVTTVLLQADPVAPANFTQEATLQEYFPEWVVAGGTLVDTVVFGRIFDQEQWSQAFGITGGGVDLAPELDPGFALHKWYTGEEPPAAETAPILYPAPSLLFAVLQSAGPNLTPETFRDGLFSGEPTQNAITAPSLSWGDHGLWDLPTPNDWSGVDDMTMFWWDAQATGPDELGREGQGMLRFVDGGKRYLPGTWEGIDQFFAEEGSVLLLDAPPEDETPPDYPSPAG